MTARRSLLLLVLLAAPVLLAGLAEPPLVDPDEGRYAWAARAMAGDGLSLTPEFNGAPRFAKPAPITWLQALAMRALGENPAALRLPGALLALGAVMLVWRLAYRLGGAWAALLAGLSFATSFRFVAVAREALVDAPLVFALSGALVELVRLVGAPPAERPRAWLRAHLWMGLGFLFKGPVAVALPWAALCLYRLS